jgi:circadian clock protein KaiB
MAEQPPQADASEPRPWELLLYVTSDSPRAAAAERNLRRICDRVLAGRYVLRVVDLLSDLENATADRVLATPTLIRKHPLPERRVIGDLSDEQTVLFGLDLRAEAVPSGARPLT